MNIFKPIKKGGELTNPVLPADGQIRAFQDPFEVDISGNYSIAGYEFARLLLVVEGSIGDDNSQQRSVIIYTE